MFGPRLNTVFASRWKALLWSASILMTAYCSIPAPDDTPDQAQTDASGAHANPWAKKGAN